MTRTTGRQSRASRATATVPRPRSPEGPPPPVPTATPEDRAALGRAARSAVPRSAQGQFVPAADRPDPVSVLTGGDAERVAELLPIRYGRMSVSPFTFYRGAAAVMAADLARTPVTGLDVQLCGDAHLSNFGFFASPERRLVFDINDFDETLPGPWEWDVKRLATSVEIAGRDRGFSRSERRTAVLSCVRSYREAMRQFAAVPTLQVWYAHADVEGLRARYEQTMTTTQRKRLARGLNKVQTKDNRGALAKFTTVVDGSLRLTAEPPLIVPLRDLIPEAAAREDLEQGLRDLVQGYRATLAADRRMLFDQYRPIDMARKVVGVGSVGTRAFMMLFFGRDTEDPLFLQAKEAGPSALEAHLRPAVQPNAGQRVVEGQRLMQTVGDIFLGWQRVAGFDGRERDFYIRQLRDWKGSVEVEDLVPDGLRIYADLCGWTLARAHARSGDRVAIAAYLGSSTSFDEAVLAFAVAYADLNERDHRAMLEAIDAGRVTAVSGV